MTGAPAGRAYERWWRRPWRAAFIVYLAALTTGTHWPRLQLDPRIPASDKVIHSIAFAGLAVLFWRTGWVRSRPLAIGLVLGWAALDELSQLLPGLGRTFAPEDYAANFLGVLVAGAWIGALAPGPDARWAVVLSAVDRACARWSTWILGLVCAVAVTAGLLALWPRLDPARTGGPTLLALSILLALAAVTIAGRVRPELRLVRAGRHCPTCGWSRALAGPDAACPGCGRSLPPAAWTPAPAPRVAWVDVALVAATLLLAAAVSAAPSVPGLPDQLRGVVSMAIAGLGLSAAARRVRTRWFSLAQSNIAETDATT